MKSKSITTIIFSIIGIVFIAIAVYGAVVKKQESDSEKYKDWTPYQDTKYGYEVKCPKGLKPEQPYGEGIVQFVKFLKAKTEVYYSVVVSDLSSGLVLVDGKMRTVASLDLKEQIVLNLKQRCKKADLESIVWMPMKIGEIEALQASSSTDECFSKYLPWTSVIKNNLIYHIKFIRGSKEEYDRLLSSFRLIEIP
ncbi:MAG: hypothetical protein ABIG90_00240 [bacterium]